MPWLFWFLSRVTFGFKKPRVDVLGSEFAGRVEAVGKRVTRFKAGDPVFGYRGPRMGAYADYLCMPENGVLAAKPVSMTYEQAAASPYGAIMALGLLRKLRLQSGQHVGRRRVGPAAECWASELRCATRRCRWCGPTCS